MWIFRTSTRVALATSRRELDASTRAPENLDPKTGMLGVTPAVVFIVVDFVAHMRSS